MEALFEVLKYTLPSLVVFATSYLIIKTFIENEEKKKKLDLRTNNQKLITPIRLQAYERVVLFLERITPDSMIHRVQSSEMSSKLLHISLLKIIRTEYEHNLSQQVYISENAWHVTKSAKENIVAVINTAADKVDPNSPSIELSREIINSLGKLETSPTHSAVDFIKKEASQFF